MKKLYLNIEDISLNGRPGLLTQAVDNIDHRMQKMVSLTETMKEIVYRYSVSNQGKQYSNACDAVNRLSHELYNASVDLNELQHQVVMYENKIHLYEGESQTAMPPRRHEVEIIRINVDTLRVKMRKSEMIEVRKALDVYCSSVRMGCKNICSDRDYIGTVWRDSQFRDFSEYIDGVCMVVESGCRKLEDYALYLQDLISKL